MYLLVKKSIDLVAERPMDVLDGKFGEKSMELLEGKSIDLLGKKSWPASSSSWTRSSLSKSWVRWVGEVMQIASREPRRPRRRESSTSSETFPSHTSDIFLLLIISITSASETIS